MSEFTKRYDKLNDNQKKAVDAIDGPVMVIAGPGTGKTELLSVRVANILRKTDAQPQNILCLTFTESGAIAMRERLAGLIGPDAYKVAIHTFHSFGTEIINSYGQYFYHGAHFRPADELSTYEIMSKLLEKLPHSNPLAATMNGRFSYIKDLQSTISDFKKSGFTPEELTQILDRNDAFSTWLKPRLQPAFSATMSKKLFPHISSLLGEIENYAEQPLHLVGYRPLHEVINDTLRNAYDESIETNSTKPLSAWKKTYLQKDAHGEQILRDANKSEKLRASTEVYYNYLVAMQEQALFDYDDMILRVVHGLEVFDELRFDLQEMYQYILVDEFQDTNDAQMRLIWNLTNNPTQNGRPNLMVVGDDDQAIYRFQGANLSNVIDFTMRYQEVTVVTLTDNYRSSSDILTLARAVIVQGEERLENTLEGIDKTLTARSTSKASQPIHNQYETEYEAHYALAEKILKDYKKDSSASRAVIARNHRQLMALLPQLEARGLPLRYEHQDNVLESEPVMQLELVARIVHYIAAGRYDDANELLPEMLSHPAWQVPAKDTWRTGLSAYKSRRFWLEEMLEDTGRLKDIAEWLIIAAHYAQNESLEYMCDHLFGVVEPLSADTPNDEGEQTHLELDEDFVSPYRAYFFPTDSLESHPGRYLSWLSALQKIRTGLRDYKPRQPLKLADFIEYIDLHRDMELRIEGRSDIEHDASAITLLTAHKSKGLEFDGVYITDAQENIWGSSARLRSRLIQFPSNLPLAATGDQDDERLRLLYVALTRAKKELILTSARLSASGKELLPIGALPTAVIPLRAQAVLGIREQTAAVENDWRPRALDVPIAAKEQLLRPMLDKYKLSATHLNNFLDVTRGGPELFLLHNLLRFPQAMSPSAAYGSAIHGALQRAHAHLASTGQKRPVEDVLHDFEELLGQAQLSDEQFSKQLERGSETLTTFLEKRYDSFAHQQTVERSFATEIIAVGDARITGAIDLIDVDHDEKTIFITDYKTGKAAHSWQGRTDYEKIKLHHYEQQLMMYKLLVEKSRQFAGYTVTGARIEFVEPDERGEIVLLDYPYDDTKLHEFELLVQAVWSRIQTLSFELPAEYPVSIRGIEEFEQELLNTSL